MHHKPAPITDYKAAMNGTLHDVVDDASPAVEGRGSVGDNGTYNF